ncbi:MAG: hypothetical protein AAF529_12225 [Pseudomonadota bacterium]
MDAKTLILEIFRETDFINESFDLSALGDAGGAQVQQSLAAINKACSAFLNGQEVEPYLEKFVRREMETDVYEEMELWGKFSPPPQFIDDGKNE